MVETSIRHFTTLKLPMLQPPSPLLEMASLRLPDSDEFDVDTRRRSNNGNVPATTTVAESAPPPGTGILLQMKNDIGDYLNNIITEVIATSPRGAMEESQVHGLFNASKTTNLSTIEQAPDRLYRHSMAMSAVYCVAYVVVFVVGLIGNSFVIAVVYRSPRMRTVTNFFIVNLAVADVLVIVFCLPATLMSNIFVREYRCCSTDRPVSFADFPCVFPSRPVEFALRKMSCWSNWNVQVSQLKRIAVFLCLLRNCLRHRRFTAATFRKYPRENSDPVTDSQ